MSVFKSIADWMSNRKENEKAQAYNDEQAKQRDIDRFNDDLDDFRTKYFWMGLPEDFKATRSSALDPSRGHHPQSGIPNINPVSGLPTHTPPMGGFNPEFGISFGSNGFSFNFRPLEFMTNKATLEGISKLNHINSLNNEAKQKEEKRKADNLFLDLLMSNQINRIFAGGDLYNAGAGSKHFNPLVPYEPYKYFMGKGFDNSMDEINAIIKNKLPQAGRKNYLSGVDSTINWAGGKDIKSSRIIFGSQLNNNYNRFSEAGKKWGIGIYGRTLGFNYELNDLYKRRVKHMVDSFLLKNKFK